MHNTHSHVLIFDSGVGGLSIVEHVRSNLPEVRLSYLADNAHAPYGLLEDDFLIERVVTIVRSAFDQLKPDVIVIACNSASTLVLPSLRAQIPVPIVGVVPAIKPAAAISVSKVIGLLATPGTIRRDYTDELIQQFAPGCQVIRVGSNELVSMVEDVASGNQHPAASYSHLLLPFREDPLFSRMDTIVLACTHFPLAKQELSAALPEINHWVDSGEAIARRVRQLLPMRQHNATVSRTSETRPDSAWFTTSCIQQNETLISTVNRFGFGHIHQLKEL